MEARTKSLRLLLVLKARKLVLPCVGMIAVMMVAASDDFCSFE
jgi:hypothetical protein